MNRKKLAVIGILAVVVIGCVLAAGCTSTGTNTQTSTADDQIVGQWMKNDGSAVFDINADKTGSLYKIKDDSFEQTPVAWSKNNDGTYTIASEENSTIITLDAVKGQFTCGSGCVFTRLTSNISGDAVIIPEAVYIATCVQEGNCPWD